MTSSGPLSEHGWRERLDSDPSTAALGARLALWSMKTSMPSYYDKDEGSHAAYALAREQAAEALIAWRRSLTPFDEVREWSLFMGHRVTPVEIAKLKVEMRAMLDREGHNERE